MNQGWNEFKQFQPTYNTMKQYGITNNNEDYNSMIGNLSSMYNASNSGNSWNAWSNLMDFYRRGDKYKGFNSAITSQLANRLPQNSFQRFAVNNLALPYYHMLGNPASFARTMGMFAPGLLGSAGSMGIPAMLGLYAGLSGDSQTRADIGTLFGKH